MANRPRRSSCLLPLVLALSATGCAGEEPALAWGTTPRGEAFLELRPPSRHGDLPPELTLVADPESCGLRLFTEPDAWLVTWCPRAGESRPSFLRVEREETASSVRLEVRELEPGTDTTALDPALGSADWPWRRSDRVYTGSALLALRSTGGAWSGRGGLGAAVRSAREGLDGAR